MKLAERLKQLEGLPDKQIIAILHSVIATYENTEKNIRFNQEVDEKFQLLIKDEETFAKCADFIKKHRRFTLKNGLNRQSKQKLIQKFGNLEKFE